MFLKVSSDGYSYLISLTLILIDLDSKETVTSGDVNLTESRRTKYKYTCLVIIVKVENVKLVGVGN